MRYLFVLLMACSLVVTPLAWSAEETSAPAPEEKKSEEKADGNSEATPYVLFNGENFEGWKLFIPDENVDPATVWSAKDGVVHCKGEPAGYMRTEKKFSNYKLTFEWRWPEKGGNSGCLLHVQGEDKVWPKSIESQLHSGDAGDFWVIGGADFKEHKPNKPGDRRVPKMKESNEKPLGEWNKKEVICSGNTIKVFVNGLLQNVATETTVKKGHIGLQSEGTPVEFRNIMLWPVPEEHKEQSADTAEKQDN
ncbi:MAG: DUF1080 domain-containing protein [Candidatus Hydrogenedentes bacterium]|nr:DUF1080 domain-containing protein [Candidatus Hydrogenedentota bacterium]